MGSSTSRSPVRSAPSRFLRAGQLSLVVVLAAIVLSACGTADSREATDVGAAGATLQGAVSPDRDEQVTYRFAYCTTASYGRTTARRTMNAQRPRSASRRRGGHRAGARDHLPLPAWTYARTGQPSQDWTLLGLATGTNRYAAFFDRALVST
jgi:hypothetical protein